MARNHLKNVVTFVITLALFSLASLVPANAFETSAKQAIVMDYATGEVLIEKNARSAMVPSSMTKVMTVYLVFERLKKGVLKLDNTFTVSERAWRTGGSKTFVNLGSSVSIEDLLRGVIVQSGNDASIVLAEGLASSEEAFAHLMNKKAEELGMKNTYFENATGWPSENHYTSAHDLAVLTRHLIMDFPEYYHYFRELEFTYNKITQHNRNLLLGRDGIDGLKTGHTEDGGYGIVISGEQEGRRMVVVVNGLTSVNERAEEADRLLLYGFRYFENKTLFSAGQQVSSADIWFGAKPSVPLVVKQDITIAVPKLMEEKIRMHAVLQSPIAAPVTEGTELAALVINIPGREPVSYPLYSGEAVGKIGWFGHIWNAAKYYINGARDSAITPAQPSEVSKEDSAPPAAPAATPAQEEMP